ncbi:hypothetical protein LTR78_002761 [Recurvomyces mirabilis]|uniref:Uncharacterized protein n=1 Tax=Recurvomyces mirabilis TaxID=574656 RepID=A0AAE0WSV1_9PEZI|nr:hypothetical protein LTR78_002761 [Recurvomyces mirabilis]KAK5159505.1 hypothetical protein LTS14_002647 [Recurvomyces mirabilis]
MAAYQHELRQQDEVAEKVLRRAQVSKMTRALQDRLALANVKIQNGWENMSLDAIEPQLEQRMRMKRPASSNDTISDTASTTSSKLQSSLASSPLTAPMFSDDFPRSGSLYSNKKSRPSAATVQRTATSGPATRSRRPRVATRAASWKSQHSLPESSPINHSKHARFASNTISHLSFISEGSTIPDSPPSPVHSEDDDTDLPVTSFSINASTKITSSPPQTPPPDRRMRKAHNVSWSRTPKNGDDGADLLMFLATSPSPAKQAFAPTVVAPPSTPPCKATPLPSSHMTPGTSGMGFMGFGPVTPGTANFNFADFVNVTPSPAQGPWQRTPVAGRTPAAAREARRRLNFDSLHPPSTAAGSSPKMTRSVKSEGLGMEWGGALGS